MCTKSAFTEAQQVSGTSYAKNTRQFLLTKQNQQFNCCAGVSIVGFFGLCLTFSSSKSILKTTSHPVRHCGDALVMDRLADVFLIFT